MNRRALAVGGLLVLVALAGCLGGGEIDEDELGADAEYDWDTNATAHYNVTTASLLSFSSNDYQAILRVESRSTLELSESTLFRGDQPVSLRALQFQYPNGTVVGATETESLTAVENSDETEIQLPAENGTVAYTVDWGGATRAWGGSPRTWRVESPVDGSHEVLMPEGSRADLPFFALTSPGGHETTVENDRAVLRWSDLDSVSLTVRYYLVFDLYLFGGLFAVAGLAGLLGGAYYYRGIRRARQKREEVGLDVEQEDDDLGDDGPPPACGEPRHPVSATKLVTPRTLFRLQSV